MKQCVKKLSFKLEDFFDDEEESKYFVRPVKIWGHSSGHLTFFSWESRRPGIYYIGIFDLNQWYSNRMLDFLRFVPSTGLCPYWVAIPVEMQGNDPLEMIPMYDVQIIPKTLERWENPHSQLDIHSYPASLSFRK